MREIGGYFGLETFTGQEYHEDLLALNNGRNALLYLLKARNIQKLYIPLFLCDSVSNLLTRYGYAYEYYGIHRDFTPAFTKKLGKDEYLYVVNFYGQISNNDIREIKKRHGNVIFDNIHAFFQKPVCGVDTIYSCRKFFGVPDGGYLATDVMLQQELQTDISKDRMKHILGRFEGNASSYHEDFKANDKLFASLELRRMSELTHNLLRAVDYEGVRRQRNENFALLQELLGQWNGISCHAPDGPYCYPFYCKNGMQVKRLLAAEKIYVATLWPNVLQHEGTLEKDFAENILPLPCDQRYDAQDMTRVAQAVQRIMGLFSE